MPASRTSHLLAKALNPTHVSEAMPVGVEGDAVMGPAVEALWPMTASRLVYTVLHRKIRRAV
jgi:hypothetical protein